jgi:hypothetical protein
VYNRFPPGAVVIRAVTMILLETHCRILEETLQAKIDRYVAWIA